MPAAAAVKKAKAAPPPKPPVIDDEEKQSGGRGTSLPLVSVLPDQETMDVAREALLEAKEIRERMDKDSERLEEIKASLVAIADAHELKGFRYGAIGMEYHGLKTKLTLDKGKLLENGVDAETIAASYKESKPFPSSRFVAVSI